MSYIVPPLPVFTDLVGEPLDNGMIYIGESPDAEDNPIAVYWDEALSEPAAQPIRTSGGYPVYQGRASQIYIAETTALITLKTASGLSVLVNADAKPFVTSAALAASTGSSLVGFKIAETGAADSNVETKLRLLEITPDDFTGTDTQKVQAALNAGGTIRLKRNYALTSGLTIYGDTHVVGDPGAKLTFSGLLTDLIKDSSVTTSSDVNTNIKLENFEIDGGALLTGNTTQLAINFYRTGNVTIRGLTVHGVGGSGIRWGNSFVDTVGVLIENCTIYDCREGDGIQGSGRRITIQNNKVGLPGSTTSNFGDTGIAVLADFSATTNPSGLFSSGVSILNNTVAGNYDGSGAYVGVGGMEQAGIAFGPFGTGVDANIQVRGNTVTSCHLSLWAIVMANVLIDGNTFGPHAATDTGNTRFDGVTNLQVTNNNIARAYASSGNDYSNILLVAQRNVYGASEFDADVADVMINGNTLSSSVGGNGIRMTFDEVNTSPSYTSQINRVGIRGNSFVGIATRVSFAPVAGTTAAVCNDVSVQGNRTDSTAGQLVTMAGVASGYTNVRLLDNTAASTVAPYSGTGIDDLIIQHKVKTSVSANSGAATTLLALPSAGYLRVDVHAWVQTGTSAFSATATLNLHNGSARISNQSDGGNLALTLSTLNLQGNQTSGGNTDIHVSAVYS